MDIKQINEKQMKIYLPVYLILYLLAAFVWPSIRTCRRSQMGNSWQIGIDEENRSELVTHGVFRVSRNPVFPGMIFTVWGLFLALPNALTFTLSFAIWFIIQIQIRLEEDFPEQQFGQSYQDYKLKTRRLL
jgi:protein-S-isoprenylcysteine O-methyltransferase Ste14